MTTQVPSQATPSSQTPLPSLLTFLSLKWHHFFSSLLCLPVPFHLLKCLLSTISVLGDPTQPPFKVCLKLCLLHDGISDPLQLEEFFFPSAATNFVCTPCMIHHTPSDTISTIPCGEVIYACVLLPLFDWKLIEGRNHVLRVFPFLNFQHCLVQDASPSFP